MTGVNDCRTMDVLPNVMIIWTEVSGAEKYNVIVCMNTTITVIILCSFSSSGSDI
jgi:hypothetical protein